VLHIGHMLDPHNSSAGMLAVGQPVQNSLPQLPADVWASIACAALRAEGDDVQAWARLCLVSRAWHSALTGAYAK